MEYVGKVVKKVLKGFGMSSGVVQSYDASSGFFDIVYEDGVSEELGFSEVASLLEDVNDAALPVDHRPRLGRKPKKRRRIQPMKSPEGGRETGNHNDDTNNVNFEITGNVDLGDDVSGDTGGSKGLSVKLHDLNVDLNETLERERWVVEDFRGSGSTQGFDLNAGFNLNLNEGFDFSEDDIKADFQGNSAKRGRIDLNVDVNGDLDENLKEAESGVNVVDTRKKECDFDLNFGIEEDVNDGIGCDYGAQGKESTPLEMVKEETQLMEEPSRVVEEDTIANGMLEEAYGSNGSCVEFAGGFKNVDIAYGGDCRVCNSTEVLTVEIIKDYDLEVIDRNQTDIRSANKRSIDRCRGRQRKQPDVLNSAVQTRFTVGTNGAVEDCTMVTDKNQGDTTSAYNEAIGRRRRGRKKKVDSLYFTQVSTALAETTVFEDSNDVKEDGIMAVNNQCETENVYKEESGGCRKRRKASANFNSMPDMTMLRRSSRRGSTKNITLNSTSSVVNDTSVSPEVSVLTEEKLVKSCRQYPEEHMILPLKLQLPPSSKNLDLDGIPVLDVFSIYACLRSFSNLLFLSPFELEEFVAAIKCNSASSLFDCIHVSILQIFRKHLEYLSSEGSESASDCLRSLNWNFLDLTTWPIFMVEYLLIHESGMKLGFDLAQLMLFKNDYYKQPVSIKVEVLRYLCDDVIEVDAVRSELSRRSSGAEYDMDLDRNVNLVTDKKKTATDVMVGSCLTEEHVEDTTDWNSDECCLCKMDGNLICCDGCPAAYHSKCVGVANDSLPEGDWYCPECAIDKHKPWSKPRKSIRGAELLGGDPHGRLYFSCCGYLLVSESGDTKISVNYYHRDELNIVIQVLKSSGMYYSSILEAIYKQFDISVNVCGAVSNLDSVNHAIGLDMCMAPAALASSEMSAIKNETVDEKKPEENIVTGCSDYCDVGGLNSVNPECVSSKESAETTQTTSGNLNFQEEGAGCSFMPISISNESQGPSKSQPMVNNSLMFTTPDFKQENQRHFAAACSSLSAVNTVDGDALQLQPGTCYINYYTFGYTASLIAEDLLRKSSDKMVDDSIKSDEDIISSQMKIMSKKCDRFHWLNALSLKSDLVKEKCGWCFSCRVASDDLGCLFNMNLASNQEGSFSQTVVIQSKRNNRGHLVDLVRQILFIEYRLLGLLLGPWLNPHFSGFWRKSILKASDIVSVKHLLLTLESNLRPLALSAEWFKHVDSAVTVGSASHVVISSSRTSLKNGIGRKRARYSESESSSARGLSLFWWRGGRLSRQLFNWKGLPRSLASKAARQAGCTKIPGILYPENSDFAKRTKCVAWQAAVESSRTAEQLALQVRELDSNIKWDEIENRQSRALLDKESRKSIRLFKKVIIRRKCMEGEEAKFLLDFGKRRIIPEVVLKNGSVVEESSSERKKYWLKESYVPLHLLKNFEEKKIARKSGTVGSEKLSEAIAVLEKHSKRKGFSYLFAKAERSEYHKCGHCNKDVETREAVCCQYCKGFFHKRHVRKSAGSITAECTYTCHQCQNGKYVKIGLKSGRTDSRLGKNNTKSLKVQQNKLQKTSVGKSWIKKSKIGLKGRPLRSQKNKKVAVVVPLRRSVRKAKSNALQNIKVQVVGRRKKKGKQTKSKKGTYKKPKQGTMWRKKRTQTYHSYWLNGLLLSRKPYDERMMQFRRERFLGPSESTILDQPKCCLCSEAEYTSLLNYISCEMCGEWFHGDAFGLDAERISMLIGFRCHACRKRKAPVCPHASAMKSHGLKMTEEQNVVGVDSVNENNQCSLTSSEVNLVQESLSNEGH